jgi:DNA polymerase II large subunit
MPIQMYIYAAIMALGLAIGGTTMYKIEHGNVLKLELAISQANTQAAEVLAIETSKVAVAEENQRKLNTQKDKDYAKLKTDSIVASNQLNAVIDGLQFTNHIKSGSSTATESNITGFNTTDDSQYTLVSKKLLNYLAGESKRADQDGIDKNRLLDFVIQDNCGIIK